MDLLVLQTSAWEAAGHWIERPVGEILGLLGLALGVVGYGVLVVRALAGRSRSRAVTSLSPADRARVREAVAAAERRTIGEILPVVVERSDEHPQANWIAALLTLLLGSALMLSFPALLRLDLLVLVQLALGGVGYATSRALPGFRRFFVSEARATQMAEEQALQEFHLQGLHQTRERTGVLLFVSLLERRVVVLADTGIHAQVDPSLWVAADEAVLGGVARKQLAEGLLAGIAAVGAVLAEHCPRGEEDREEIPNRLIVRES